MTGAGSTIFEGIVGGTTPLASLSSGITEINTTGITTVGTQTYTGAVTLTAAPTLTTTDSNVTFESTVDGDYALTTVTGAGSTIFEGIVGGTTALASLSAA